MITPATLILNKNAGSTDRISSEELLTALAQAGYDAICRQTESEDELDDILADTEGLVIAAGGDGTLRAVALRLVGKDVPLSLIPLGTANNIANTFGVKGDPLAIVKNLQQPRKRHFDIGHLVAPWGESYFLEGAGYGFFADTLALYDPEQGKSVFRGISTFTQTLSNYGLYDGQLMLDGKDITGDYLMVEVLNTKAVGPRLSLAPDADPNDGFLDVVCVHHDDQVNFLRYVTGLLTQGFDKVPNVRNFSGKKLTFEWTGFPIHVDAEVHPHRNGNGKLGKSVEELAAERPLVTLEVLPHALELWLPPGVTS